MRIRSIAHGAKCIQAITRRDLNKHSINTFQARRDDPLSKLRVTKSGQIAFDPAAFGTQTGWNRPSGDLSSNRQFDVIAYTPGFTRRLNAFHDVLTSRSGGPEQPRVACISTHGRSSYIQEFCTSR